MTEDTAALVETVREELVHEHDATFCYTGHHRLSKCGLADARAALDTLAQRLADAERERDNFSVRAASFAEDARRAEARATRAEAALREIDDLRYLSVSHLEARQRMGTIASAALTPTEEPEHGYTPEDAETPKVLSWCGHAEGECDWGDETCDVCILRGQYRTLAQRLADATENEEHAVQAFKAAEARAERAEAALRDAEAHADAVCGCRVNEHGWTRALTEDHEHRWTPAVPRSAKSVRICAEPGCGILEPAAPTEEPEHGYHEAGDYP